MRAMSSSEMRWQASSPAAEFQGRRDVEKVAHILHRQLCGAGAAMRQQHHMALGREHFQGLAQRRAGDAEFGAERLLLDAAAGGDLPFDQQRAEM